MQVETKSSALRSSCGSAPESRRRKRRRAASITHVGLSVRPCRAHKANAPRRFPDAGRLSEGERNEETLGFPCSLPSSEGHAAHATRHTAVGRVVFDPFGEHPVGGKHQAGYGGDAFCSSVRMTWVGARTSIATMSMYSPVAAL